MGFFDKPFDFNKDGKLSPFEKAARAAAITEILKDDDERREVLEEAGLDPDEYILWEK